MITTKSPILFALTLLMLITLSACKKCKNENPRGRITNNGTKSASVQIKTSGGNTENINNVMPGTRSELRSYAPGLVTFTITVDNKTNVVKALQMNNCTDYEIAIDANNVVTTQATDRND